MQQQSGVIDDNSLATYAYSLARAERYQEALDVLDLMQDPNTAVALNYRGYATRKLGHLEEGIEYYLQSVALDPNYVLVREYLFEAYVQQGRLDLAEEQLMEIAKRCGEFLRLLRRALRGDGRSDLTRRARLSVSLSSSGTRNA